MDNLFSEDWAIVACIDPDAYSANTYTSDEIDRSLWEQLAVVLMVGDLGASASVAATVKDSATSGGSLTTISGKTTTVGGTSPNTGSNTQQVIHVRSDENNSNARYVKVEMVVATATSDAGLIVLGKGRHRPASDNDLSSVTVN